MASGQSGPKPFTFTEIEAFKAARRIKLWPQEVDVLCDMDNAYLRGTYAAMEEARREREARQKAKEEALKMLGGK